MEISIYFARLILIQVDFYSEETCSAWKYAYPMFSLTINTNCSLKNNRGWIVYSFLWNESSSSYSWNYKLIPKFSRDKFSPHICAPLTNKRLQILIRKTPLTWWRWWILSETYLDAQAASSKWIKFIDQPLLQGWGIFSQKLILNRSHKKTNLTKGFCLDKFGSTLVFDLGS